MTCQRQSSDLGCWMVPRNLGMKNDTNQPVSRNETTNETDLSSFSTQAKCEWDLLRAAAAAASVLFLQVETKQKDGQVIKGKRSSRQRRWSGRKKKKLQKPNTTSDTSYQCCGLLFCCRWPTIVISVGAGC